MSKVYLKGVSKGVQDTELELAIRSILLEATDNLSWLKPGQTVLLKPAVNSPDIYPATTHPLAVTAVARELMANGAKVIVGDQSGIGHVMHTPRGVTQGSTRANMQQCGITRTLDPGVVTVAFEEGDWEQYFYRFFSDQTKNWSDGLYVTRYLDKVDHVINLPRLSTHAMAGVTLGFKNLVGLLREDSRVEFHANGPFFGFMKPMIKQEKFKIDHLPKQDFFKKITEVSLATKDKLRLTLFVGTRAQLTMGPDKVTYRLLGKLFESFVAEPETGLVFASVDQVAAEVTAIGFMTEMYRTVSWRHKSFQKILMAMNGQAKELGDYSVWLNPCVEHALTLGLGEKHVELVMRDVPNELTAALQKNLV